MVIGLKNGLEKQRERQKNEREKNKNIVNV
jgi:hypothetical protein